MAARKLNAIQRAMMRLARVADTGQRSRRSHFQAANISRLTSSWVTAPIRQDFAARQDLSTLRARARELVRDNDYARRAQNLIIDNVVGPHGIQLQSLPVTRDRKIDREAARMIEFHWREWSNKSHADISRQLGWRDFQRMTRGGTLVDGEAFIRIHEGQWAGDPYRFALEFIDPERIPSRLNNLLQAGSYIRGGIEFDFLARPVAYHVRVDGNSNSIYYDGLAYDRVSASDMVHCFKPEYAAQTRGYPEMSAGMMSLFHLGGFKEAAIMSARAGAAKMGFFTNPDGEELPGDDNEEDGTPIMDFDPMTIHDIGNRTFTEFDPGYPNGEFGPFVKACLQAFASSLNISYNTLANDLEGVSFSALKTGKDDERNSFECEQQWLIERLCAPIYDRWLRRQITNQTFSAKGPGALSELTYERCRFAAWQPHTWPEIDPLKSASADSTRIKDRTVSRSELIRLRSRDPEEVWREMDEEAMRLGKMAAIPEATAEVSQAAVDPAADTDKEDGE